MWSSEDRELTPEEKLERSRVRNRDHSRKSRQRKKALVEGMKKQVRAKAGGGGGAGSTHRSVIEITRKNFKGGVRVGYAA